MCAAAGEGIATTAAAAVIVEVGAVAEISPPAPVRVTAAAAAAVAVGSFRRDGEKMGKACRKSGVRGASVKWAMDDTGVSKGSILVEAKPVL